MPNQQVDLTEPSVECPVGDFFACGWGHYVGTSGAWGVHNNGWWGEGEIKFYMDGDTKAPDGSIQYHEFTTPYSGLPQVIRGDGHCQAMQRFGLCRWHIKDLIRFEKDLKVTIQALGWRSGGR